MNNDQKRTVLAFVLTGVIVFTWQALFSSNQPVQQPVKQEQVQTQNTKGTATTSSSETKPIATQTNKATNLTSVTLKAGSFFYTVNSDLSFSEAAGNKTSMTLKELSDKDNFFNFKLIDTNNNLQNFNFVFDEQTAENEVVGNDLNKQISIRLKLEDDGRLTYQLNGAQDFRLSYNMSATEKQSDNRTYRQYVVQGMDTDRYNLESDEKGEGSLKWVALDFNHHVFFNVFTEKQTINYMATESGEIFFQTVNGKKNYNGYVLYALKNYDYLLGFDNQLDLSIDFGIFGIFAVPILKAMQMLYTYVGNYGVAIILLTIVIRLATYPLQAKSFRSMKKMQVLQPEIAKLKEKYADDPMKQQKETMELFKRSGASPLGGCLPMVLQIPIFIAFYQAISNSVELVGSPFYFWLTDLSAKDPYYILPAIMGITMLVQTKLNPSTSADPNQQKIMYIMPIVFIFIMKDLPAGLNLYFTVSNILGIAQQLYVYKTAEA
ncbi:membrane protein insertase YidC [Halobacteriovorax sp. ZH4_bin.1]|uniref:membrane protein insertase YidC n=1 Tax=unclassified Halobacteriovorax TaxID=2639665 RepID=UPI00371711C7